MGFTIGSLFDGSGGFPLAATMCGGTPLWASEVEPFPIAVTWSRFPGMKHLGSVTDVKGDEVEPVDVITFGSPCQDLSVAGKRAGLKHEDNGDDETTRSGLFMEAVRIIKEMRKATNGKYPKFAVWENVPGAFSSNKGEDFRTVCEELIKIVEPGAVMPAVPKNGWPYADVYCGEGWSLAYRVYDAQYWGVPQRRRRIYLVLDLTGERAGKISFEREGLRGYFAEGRTPGQGTSPNAESCPGTDDREIEMGERGSGATYINGVIPINTLCISHGSGGDLRRGDGIGELDQPQFTISCGHPNAVCYSIEKIILDDQGGQQIAVRMDGKSPTLIAEMHGNVPAVMAPVGFDVYNMAVTGDKAKTLNSAASDADHVPCVMEAIGFDRYNQCSTGDVCETLRTPGGGDNYPVVCYKEQPIPIHDQATRFSGKRGSNQDGKGNGLGVGDSDDPMYTLTSGDRHGVAYSLETFHCTSEEEKTTTLKARDYKDPVCDAYGVGEPIALDRAYFNQGQNALYDPQLYEDGTNPTLVARGPNAVCVRYIVRRLTPTECARLQGFADRWAVPISKEGFTDEEYAFWLNVRNTHAEINGKATKDYTKEQMLAWYNKLHTDSSEYKLWGNGIALPTALYVMQGIADVLNQ